MLQNSTNKIRVRHFPRKVGAGMRSIKTGLLFTPSGISPKPSQTLTFDTVGSAARAPAEDLEPSYPYSWRLCASERVAVDLLQAVRHLPP